MQLPTFQMFVHMCHKKLRGADHVSQNYVAVVRKVADDDDDDGDDDDDDDA